MIRAILAAALSFFIGALLIGLAVRLGNPASGWTWALLCMFCALVGYMARTPAPKRCEYSADWGSLE